MSCKFYILGLHDNYLVESEGRKFILRIYRNEWRSEDEILFELEFLKFLHGKSVRIAQPLITHDGKTHFCIEGPEGKRFSALFEFAEGYAPENEISVEECELLGKHAANLHLVSKMFSTKYKRAELDLIFLLDRSINLIEPFVDPEDNIYLNQLQTRIHDNIPNLPLEGPEYCVCVGDINATNFHINSKQEITMFDFDQCGYGHRAFDIGKFISSMSFLKSKADNANAFLNGYQTVNQLSDIELESIPYFEVISKIWVMAIHIDNANQIGHKYLDRSFWVRRMRTLKEIVNNMV